MSLRAQSRRRREQRHAIYDNEIASPCVGICQLDQQKLCIGCQRDVDEIRNWMIMSKQEKMTVLINIKQRQDDKNGLTDKITQTA